MKGQILCVLALVGFAGDEVRAVVIDAFEDGAISLGPDVVEMQTTQTGLPGPSVIGGGRDWFAFFEGSFAVGAPDGTLNLDHDHGPFEVFTLQYGRYGNNSPLAPLNVDLMADGATQFTMRVAHSSAGSTEVEKMPMFVTIGVRSGVGTENAVGGLLSIRPIVSDDAFVVQAPFSNFSKFAGEIDFTDVDGIYLSFVFEEFASIEIDEFTTSAGLVGDYNLDGVVDAADYTTWRNNVDAVTLPNRHPDNTGPVGEADYVAWKSQYGKVFGASSAETHGMSAPEPGVAALMVATLVCAVGTRRKRHG